MYPSCLFRYERMNVIIGWGMAILPSVEWAGKLLNSHANTSLQLALKQKCPIPSILSFFKYDIATKRSLPEYRNHHSQWNLNNKTDLQFLILAKPLCKLYYKFSFQYYIISIVHMCHLYIVRLLYQFR